MESCNDKVKQSNEKYLQNSILCFSFDPPPPPDVPLSQTVPRAHIHDMMFNKLKDHFGVHVYLSVYHSGKSNSARVVAKMLWDIRRSVKVLNSRADSTAENQASAENWLKCVLGYTAEEDDRLCINECFDNHCTDQTDHATIIIDAANVILRFDGWDELIG